MPNKPLHEGKPVESPRRTLAPTPPDRQGIQNMPTRMPVNQKRVEERQHRRSGTRQLADELQHGRPRPSVRPAAPPMRVMPNTPAPVQTSAPNLVRRSLAPVSAPVAGAFGLLALNTVAADSTISAEVSSLQSSLSDLQNRSTFTQIFDDVSNLDKELDRLSGLLESARQEGYRYQADLEQVTYNALNQWEAARPLVLQNLQLQVNSVQAQLPAINPVIQNLNNRLNNPSAAAPLLRSTQTQVNQILERITQIERDLNGRYEQIGEQVRKANERLTDIHWALDQLKEAKFTKASGEDLVMAVLTRWDKEGKDDPEGILYLTNKRLVFERKEKVATKKILFITTASELVHEILIDQPLSNVRKVQADSRGLFGHQDFLLVEFSDPKFKHISFHINGQDSKEWAPLVERSRSGQIEADRVNLSGSLSMGDLKGSVSTADIMKLQEEVNNLQDEMMLKTTRQELSGLENEVRSLERSLADLRAHGYEIEKDLEADISILAAQWDRIKTNAENTLQYQTGLMGEQMQSIQQSLAQLVGMSANLTQARPLYMQVKSATASAQAQADAAEATVLAQYDQYADEVEALSAHMEWVGWMLDALSSASFRLMATEAGVAAVEAVFKHPDWNPENGILFLTDQRLLWEDRVGDYELKINVPLADIQNVKQSNEEQSERQVLVFHFGPQAPVPLAEFELALPVANDWIKMVGRARSGGYAEDRAVAISPEELERVRNAPQQCSKCGAAFTAPLLRGQTEIHCEYCGLVTRI
jgi:predicted nuclease with TOPRIM domain